MLILAATLATLIGGSLGLLGGGGSILTLPMLVYVLGLAPKDAIAASLFVVGVTSAVGVVAHARAGRVAFRVGLTFGVAGMAGAYAGGRVARFVPAELLLAGFAVMMLATSIGMLRGRRADSGSGAPAGLPKIAALGLAAGAVSGMVGAGGGFIVVPALALVGGLPMPRAIATSLLVIALQSLAGFAGHAAHAHLDPLLLGVVTLAAVVGSVAGAAAARRVRPETLRVSFGWLVLAMGCFLLAKQLPVELTRHVHLPSLAAGAALVVAIWLLRVAGRARAPHPPTT